MLYIVPKTFDQANFENKAMTASVYGHNFAVKFQRPELENIFAIFTNCIGLFCSFVFFLKF